MHFHSLQKRLMGHKSVTQLYIFKVHNIPSGRLSLYVIEKESKILRLALENLITQVDSIFVDLIYCYLLTKAYIITE